MRLAGFKIGVGSPKADLNLLFSVAVVMIGAPSIFGAFLLISAMAWLVLGFLSVAISF